MGDNVLLLEKRLKRIKERLNIPTVPADTAGESESIDRLLEENRKLRTSIEKLVRIQGTNEEDLGLYLVTLAHHASELENMERRGHQVAQAKRSQYDKIYQLAYLIEHSEESGEASKESGVRQSKTITHQLARKEFSKPAVTLSRSPSRTQRKKSRWHKKKWVKNIKVDTRIHSAKFIKSIPKYHYLVSECGMPRLDQIKSKWIRSITRNASFGKSFRRNFGGRRIKYRFVNNDISLSSILRYHLTSFLKFANETYSIENVLFWGYMTILRGWSSVGNSKYKKRSQDLIRKMLENFILPNSECELNIRDDEKDKLCKFYEDLLLKNFKFDPDPEVFAEVSREIDRFLINDIYPKYLNTPDYNQIYAYAIQLMNQE